MKKSQKNLLIFTVVLFIISSCLVLLGSLAKLQHWPIAGALLIIGILTNISSFIIGGILSIQVIRTK
jgi:uncharacterized membrane protein (DUF485 family)